MRFWRRFHGLAIGAVFVATMCATSAVPQMANHSVGFGGAHKIGHSFAARKR